MIEREHTLLEIVEDHSEREAIIKEYDKTANVCLLCTNLFDSIADIENKYGIDLTEMLQRLNGEG